jgi:hypothetical protein
MVNYADYFKALGFKTIYYDMAANKFYPELIIERIKKIQESWKEKYPNMDFKTQNLQFDNLVHFNLTFTNEMEFLNMEAK